MGYVTLTTPLSEKIFIGRVGLATVNLYTKFEVSRCTHYQAMNGSAKCREWGGLETMSPFDRAHTTSY